ncbi:MAG: DUF2442 domain-containing protein, partial [Firmicutes bacterium]|nr:DUF2442 domain-containing protein [Bacillota bacterium]
DDMIPTVVQAYATADYHIVVQFDDGKIVRWDMRPLIERGGVFAALRDPAVFQGWITVLNGTVAWSADFDARHCVDLDPVTLHDQGEDVTDQLTDHL